MDKSLTTPLHVHNKARCPIYRTTSSHEQWVPSLRRQTWVKQQVLVIAGNTGCCGQYEILGRGSQVKMAGQYMHCPTYMYWPICSAQTSAILLFERASPVCKWCVMWRKTVNAASIAGLLLAPQPVPLLTKPYTTNHLLETAQYTKLTYPQLNC